ncbi:hypothetical protein ACLB2K_026739 [Fragaria x ananassa]
MVVFQLALIRDEMVCVGSHADWREDDQATPLLVAMLEGGSRVLCCDFHPDLRYVFLFSSGFVDNDDGGWDVDSLPVATLAKRCAATRTLTWARAALYWIEPFLRAVALRPKGSKRSTGSLANERHEMVV